jgi:DNA-binding MarR family transcriptional regulator
MAGRAPVGDAAGAADTERLLSTIELLFFAYRDFTGEPDSVLAEFGFGRAHHRVLHFVARNPGLRVAQLLEILKITKQSLARVLKQLIEEGFVAQAAGHDRRERLLYVTAAGRDLAARLAGLQMDRIARALAEAGPHADVSVRRFLLAMVADNERPGVEALLGAPPGERCSK